MHSNNNAVLVSLNELPHQVDGHDHFLISKERLAEIVEMTNPTKPFQDFEHIVSALKTNVDAGIIGDQRDLLSRRKQFGSNTSSQECSPQETTKRRLKQLVSDALTDTTIILLLCCATLSLAIGIKKNGLEEGLIDGAMVLLAISLVVTFGAIFSFFKSKWMIKKSLKKHMKLLNWVVRNGIGQKIPETQVVVGDIVWLYTGDHVPADGIFIDGDSIDRGSEKNTTLFYGAKVVNGHCRMMVLSVGENTERSRLIKSISQRNDDHDHDHDHQNPLRLRFFDAIDETNSKLEKIWLSLSLLLLTVQLVRCFVMKPDRITDKNQTPDPKGVKNTMEDLMNESIKLMKKERSKANGLVTTLCILLFATRDGLPLAIFITLLYASNIMKSSCGAVIQKLPASATIGLVTTVCIDKNSDLVLQYTKMADLWVGFQLIDDVHKRVDNEILDFLREGIFLNSYGDGQDNVFLLCWAKAVLGDLNMEAYRDCSIVRYERHDDHMDPDMNLISRCLVIKRDKLVSHVHRKGADPKLIVSMCSYYYTADGEIETLDDDKRAAFVRIAEHLVARGVCCFAFACKREIEDEVFDDQETLEQGLTLLALVALKNPYPQEVIQAVDELRKSEVGIKLMVDDDVNTARIIALNCGLLRPDDRDNIGDIGSAIIDAAEFRAISKHERMDMIDDIQVMANSTPSDRLLMLQCLRGKGEIVASIASSIRDAPLLKEADVGIFAGDQCEEISKEDCDIFVFSNDNRLSQIHEIINMGKRVCESLESLISLQLTLEISAFAINFVALAAVSTEVVSSFQVLWISLIMEVLGASAIAITTIRVDHERTGSKPVYGSGRVITRAMYINIAIQSLFQVTIILIMGMKGKVIFHVNEERVLKSMVFNCYAFCQVFLLLSAIHVVKENRNVFVGLFRGRNWMFWGIVVIIGILQVPLVEVMGVVAHWETLDVKKWGVCVGIASFSVPLRFGVNWIATVRWHGDDWICKLH